MSLTADINAILDKEPGTLPAELARQLGATELEVLRHMPEGMATELPATQFEAILKDVKTWGNVTTIVESAGSIFELKCPFPNGSSKFGYYNLGGPDTPFHGHLKLDTVAAIFLVSKLFHGVMTHQIMFIDTAGGCIFKIYLGRNKDRSFIEGQEARFTALKSLAATDTEAGA
ncbi:MAG TPA: heme utilization cystosolic carrier protein HutX [Gammaproteobacteria bacterium]|jgi:putative heme utilization carrier protein HutX|nr:heme utilization cystosolic carrier protein HutX [Gammaproteobacteria bacterium]